MVTIQPLKVMVSITSFTITTTLTCNSIITSGDNYKNIIMGNLVIQMAVKTISIQNCVTVLEDSFIETTIAELIKIAKDEATIALIETYTTISNKINVTE